VSAGLNLGVGGCAGAQGGHDGRLQAGRVGMAPRRLIGLRPVCCLHLRMVTAAVALACRAAAMGGYMINSTSLFRNTRSARCITRQPQHDAHGVKAGHCCLWRRMVLSMARCLTWFHLW
jgi:hypothetical protein